MKNLSQQQQNCLNIPASPIHKKRCRSSCGHVRNFKFDFYDGSIFHNSFHVILRPTADLQTLYQQNSWISFRRWLIPLAA
ncbi:CLUMA_CG021624, isoform A [Clunio marinus]|uniref:CLUMA_CG021624, isoform A n=1 Tax=Clunio marinus TaxID=568069 RepID=A0A1J1J8Z5_9DIPT|nr:CLUMA_CG021624, isoform A [Clunio marinus]